MKLQVIAAAALTLVAIAPAHASEQLAKKYACVACHNVKGAKSVGPTYADVAKKYAGQKDIEAKLAEKVKKGGTGVWGQVPMPPNPSVPDADVRALVKWILSVK
ncbi:MAG TPA: c-type cytochrome [Burkholderiales bacterium]|jgi:cytochrome c|nr:c-type cytochrome [Burkholderiales bacterium]